MPGSVAYLPVHIAGTNFEMYTPEQGWSLLGTLFGISGPAGNIMYAWNPNEDPTPTIFWQNTRTYHAIGMEIKRS